MNAILHCDKKWGIGKNNDLMFRLPLDLKRFRTVTLHKVVVMGSNTLLSLPRSKPLINRTNIVLWPGGDTKKAEEDGFVMIETLDELLAEIKKYPIDDVFVIGGAMMYRTLLPYCENALVTKVDADGDAETFFPNLDELPNWTLIFESKTYIDNGYSIRFCLYNNSEVKPL